MSRHESLHNDMSSHHNDMSSHHYDISSHHNDISNHNFKLTYQHQLLEFASPASLCLENTSSSSSSVSLSPWCLLISCSPGPWCLPLLMLVTRILGLVLTHSLARLCRGFLLDLCSRLLKQDLSSLMSSLISNLWRMC